MFQFILSLAFMFVILKAISFIIKKIQHLDLNDENSIINHAIVEYNNGNYAKAVELFDIAYTKFHNYTAVIYLHKIFTTKYPASYSDIERKEKAEYWLLELIKHMEGVSVFNTQEHFEEFCSFFQLNEIEKRRLFIKVRTAAQRRFTAGLEGGSGEKITVGFAKITQDRLAEFDKAYSQFKPTNSNQKQKNKKKSKEQYQPKEPQQEPKGTQNTPIQQAVSEEAPQANNSLPETEAQSIKVKAKESTNKKAEPTTNVNIRNETDYLTQLTMGYQYNPDLESFSRLFSFFLAQDKGNFDSKSAQELAYEFMGNNANNEQAYDCIISGYLSIPDGKELQEAKYWLEKKLEAFPNSKQAQYQLACLLLVHFPGYLNKKQAEAYLEDLAAQNYADSTYQMAVFYRDDALPQKNKAMMYLSLAAKNEKLANHVQIVQEKEQLAKEIGEHELKKADDLLHYFLKNHRDSFMDPVDTEQ